MYLEKLASENKKKKLLAALGLGGAGVGGALGLREHLGSRLLGGSAGGAAAGGAMERLVTALAPGDFEHQVRTGDAVERLVRKLAPGDLEDQIRTFGGLGRIPLY